MPFQKSEFNGIGVVLGSVSFVRGPAMDTRHSYYLHSKPDDFAEPAADASRLDLDDILFIMPANDNVRTRDRLSARCGSLLRRLISLHGVRWPE